MSLSIVQIGNPVLRKKSHKIPRVTAETRRLADEMLETMREAHGVGLAAPQVGELVRLIVVEFPEDDEKEDSPLRTYQVVNPEIIWRSEEMVIGVEGCLSIPGLAGEVERHEAVKIRGLDVYGRPVKYDLKGWIARIFQHEIDHLDGICYVDRSSNVWQLGAESDEAEDGEMEAAVTAGEKG